MYTDLRAKTRASGVFSKVPAIGVHRRPFFPSSSAAVFPSGAVAAYEFDSASGLLVDSTGRGNTLTNNNSATATTGKIAEAATLVKSSTQYLSSMDTADLSMGDIDYTITTWAKATTLPGQMWIVDKQDSSVSKAEYGLYYDNVAARFTYQAWNSSASSIGSVKADTLGAPSTGTWYFIVIQHDSVNNLLKISVNNGAFDTVATTGVPADTTARFGIGRYSWSGSTLTWDGQIDQTVLFKRLLTAAEITTMYNNGNGLAYA